jgi:hypothetical protein
MKEKYPIGDIQSRVRYMQYHVNMPGATFLGNETQQS